MSLFFPGGGVVLPILLNDGKSWMERGGEEPGAAGGPEEVRVVRWGRLSRWVVI